MSLIDSSCIADDRDLCLPHLHSMPHLGGPCLNIATTFCMEKLEWFGYTTVKNSEDMFTRFDRIHEHDRQRDGRTLHDGIGRT